MTRETSDQGTDKGKVRRSKVAAGTKYGLGPKVAAGDNYGIGFKQPVGKMRGGTGSVGYRPVSLKHLAVPPASVV